MVLKIQQECLEKTIELSSSIISDYLGAMDKLEIKTLLAFGFLLERLKPDESRAATKRLLLRRAEAIESEIIDYYMNRCGWVYGELSTTMNVKIMSLLKVGHEFVGSYSEALYGSLHSYVDRFKSEGGYVFDNLWDLCLYLDVLLNLFDNGKKEYEQEIAECVGALIEGLRKIAVSDQLKSYGIWLVHRAYENRIVKPSNSLDFEKLTDELASKVSSVPLEIGLWILSNCVDIGTVNPKMIKVLEDFVARLNLNDLWKESSKSSFLVLTSYILKMTDTYLEIPYATVSAKETPFFGIVAETLLKGAFDIEKEKKTTDLDENSLRNRFLAILKARFDGLASSETFRCKGLTDIIVTNPKNHYEEIVIECKIWRGEKYYHEAIDQAMSYLTRSEDKVIILVFFKDDANRWDAQTKLREAIKRKTGYQGLAEGVVDLAQPYFQFRNQYLFSWQGREDNSRVGVHHICVDLS